MCSTFKFTTPNPPGTLATLVLAPVAEWLASMCWLGKIQWVKNSLRACGEKLNLAIFFAQYIGANFGEIFPGKNFLIYGTMFESSFAGLVQGWFGLDCVAKA